MVQLLKCTETFQVEIGNDIIRRGQKRSIKLDREVAQSKLAHVYWKTYVEDEKNTTILKALMIYSHFTLF